MPIRTSATIAVLWLLSLLSVGAWASQRTSGVPVPTSTGGDIGFVVENQRNGAAVGRFVVRVDGQWLEVQLAPRPTLAK